MRHNLIVLLMMFFIINTSKAQTSDDPISPVQAVNMLGKGMLFEPQAGDVDLVISAPYKPEYGQLLKDSGFKSVRIRYQGDRNPMMQAIIEGAPYDADDQALIDELKGIVDDLLSKDLAVVITFFGVDGIDDGDGITDLQKYKDWWGFIAENFKDYDHRVIFNLFVEPYDLWKNTGEEGVRDYYKELTDTIRTTNPTRLIIYFAIPPTPDDNPYGPGENNFVAQTVDLIPESAGIYYMWDFHVLKDDTRDNIRLVEQAWEYQDSTKQAVWSGAWYTTSSDIPQWRMESMAINTNWRFIDRGISYAYLMMFDGHTGIYDAQNDRNENGILDEWTYPGLDKILTDGPDIWWNLLSNPGFERDTTDKWTFSIDDGYSYEELPDEHYIKVNNTGSASMYIRQDVTTAILNNDKGKYDCMLKIKSEGSTTVKIFVKSTDDAGNVYYGTSTGDIVINSSDGPVLIHDTLSVNWDGNLESAVFTIKITGDECSVDKTGLTRFYYPNPVLDETFWPGERVNIDNYTTRSTSTIDINVEMRAQVKNELADGNSEMSDVTDSIHIITQQLEDRLKELIDDSYNYTSDDTQYRLGGYYQGTDSVNVSYKTDVYYWIDGKDQLAYDLNQKLIDLQNQACDILVLDNDVFKELFYDVFRDYPESVKSDLVTMIDTTVSVDKMTLTAGELNAEYQWCDCDNLYNPVRGATGTSFTASKSGNYAVKITQYGYTLVSGCHHVDVITDIDKNNANNNTAKVYPVPAHDFINIETSQQESVFNARLIDIRGRTVRKYTNLAPPVANIRTEVPQGMYFLEILFKDRREIFKILIK
ncbi:MAG: cellulase family glycosylhydrolase [Chlorobi bacterium]|nr:cellulase family glycosylhydrolase [Chlorobiota bacterium]